MAQPDNEYPDLPEPKFLMNELVENAERRTGLDLKTLHAGDHLNLVFSNENDLDAVSSLRGTFVVDGFEASFELNPPPPVPVLKYVEGDALPPQFQRQPLQVVGATLGAVSSVMRSVAKVGLPLEMRGPDGRTVLSQPVSDFTVLRPSAEGDLREVPPNALARTFESARFSEADELVSDVEGALFQLGIDSASSLNRKLGIPGGPDHVLDGEVRVAGDYAKAFEDEYYVYSGESHTMYVLRRAKGGGHIQIGVFRGLEPSELAKLAEVENVYVNSLVASGQEQVTYNMSNTSTVFDGGIAYSPSSEDTTQELGLEQAVKGSRHMLMSPVFNVDPTGETRVELHSYLYTQDENARAVVEQRSHLVRTDEDLTVQIGSKTIHIPTKFDDSDLMAALSRMRGGQH